MMLQSHSMSDLAGFLESQLADCGNHWSLGTFGALAEFTRDVVEPTEMRRDDDTVAVTTPRGGIRLEAVPELRPFASESTTRENWSHRVALCLPAEGCVMNRRVVLTELGPDVQALRERDRDAVLFDLGLDAVQVDACIRVADPELAAKLRACVGRPVFETGNPAMSLIVPASPHRVFISRLGRIEVFQPIPPPHGTSPEGPHTHVLPRLLGAGRTHPATEPVPERYVPCAHLYPAHPIKDALGRVRPFDGRRHDVFQGMLRRFGDPAALRLKQEVITLIERGGAPSDIAIPNDRFARTNVRVAIRQMRVLGGPLPSLAAWAEALDHVRADADADDAEPHHAN